MFEDRKHQIMLYCAADPINTGSRIDVAFPHQLEVKVNGHEVKANFKGIKNKPGSTRPTNITDFVTKGQTNFVTITYALTHKRFYLVATLVKKRSVDELVERIQRGGAITRQAVLNDSRLPTNNSVQWGVNLGLSAHKSIRP